MKKRHSEEQIIYAMKRIEGGSKGVEVCRELGISEQTLYNWKRKYAGMGVGELRRLKQLEDENRRIKNPRRKQRGINRGNGAPFFIFIRPKGRGIRPKRR